MNNRIDFAKVCVILMLLLVLSIVKAQSRCDIAFRGALVLKRNISFSFLQIFATLQ